MNIDQLATELELLELMTAGYVGSILRAARAIPDDKWNWSISERTPTAREICEHTFAWLWCDRQQMTVLDRSQHRQTPYMPPDRQSMIRLLEEEAGEWRSLISGLTPEQLLDNREAFDGQERNLRSFFFHMGQHVMNKSGQIFMLYFELGLDGEGIYTAPWPNEIYGFADTPSWPAPRLG